MAKKNMVFANGAMGLLSQMMTLLFTFVTRNLFIKYIGMEILGLNGTFTSVLSTLSLAELGFQSAIVYSLYKPLHDQDTQSINAVMNIFKLIYRFVGGFFVAASFAILPFLRFVLKGIEVGPTIYFYFLLQAAASSCTYFLAYKRAILYADQREYVSKTIDMVVNVVSNILQCIALGVLRSYVGYLLIRIVQVIVSNVIVHGYCSKHYPYLKKTELDKEKLREIWKNVKNIFAGRIASYIYTSTDNLVISTFVSTITVGFLVNYTTVTNSMKTLTNSMLSPIIPSIGNFLIEEQDGAKRERMLLLYTHIRYIIAVLLLVPVVVLIDNFITWWIGADMILAKTITYLLVADFYIHLVHSATADFINGAGLFRFERNINIAGAVCNIVTSLILVHFMSVEGVLIGTVLSQMVVWAGRSYVVYSKCINGVKKRYAKYWLRNLFYVVVMVLGCLLCRFGYSLLPISNILLRFVAGGVMCEVLLVIYLGVVFFRFDEQKVLLNKVKGILKRKRA